jgi:CheY-like chemotaxis protein
MATILVVEDESLLRADLVEFFQYEGYTVFEASNGLEALELIYQEPPTVILSDLRMPQLDGFGLLEQLHNSPDLQKIPVIIMSAHSNQEEIDRAKGLGAIYFIKKPLSLEDLIKYLRNIISD